MGYTVSVIDSRNDGNRVMKVQAIYERMREQWAQFRSASLKAFEYVVGDQIDPEVRKKLQNENRPAMVFNLMQPKIVTIAGLLESNRMYMKAVPVGEGDEQLADMHTQLVSDWAMRNCNGVKEITKAALDAAIGKIGWINNYWSTKEKVEGKWYTESYDPFMIMFDPDGRKQDQSDWRYMCVTGFYTADEIISIYADRMDEDLIQRIRDADERISGIKNGDTPTSWVERVWSGVQDFFSRASSAKKSVTYEGGTINDFVDSRTGRYRVIEFHDRRTKVRTLFYNAQTRETREMNGGENLPPGMEKTAAQQQLDALNMASGGGWVKKTFVTQELWITACAPWLLPNEMLYEVPYPVQGHGFQFKPIFCYDFHPDITRTQSLIDILIDPQDSYNQRRMTFLEWLMNAVNPDWMVPQNSIDGKDIPVWQSRARGKLKFFMPIGGQKPEPQHPLVEGQALKTFSDEDRDLAEVLTNITPNTQGQSEQGNESGVLFAQKVQRALTALSYFFGNVQAAMKETFTYCDANLQVFMDTPRKIRLLNHRSDPSWMAINWPTLQGVINDVTEGEFDFTADTVQLGETAKQVKFAEALAFIKSVPPELVKWDELFELWDSPVADVMREYAAQMMGIALQAQQQAAMQQAQAAQLQNVQGAAGAISALDQAAGVDANTMIARKEAEAQAAGQGPDGQGMNGRNVIGKGSA